MAIQETMGQVVLFPSSGIVVNVERREADYGRTGLKGLRLTRRGRVVVWILALSTALLAGLFLGGVASADSVPEVVELQPRLVQQGESLWVIARDLSPERDARDVVLDIMKLNNLKDSTLQAGSTIVLPVKAGAGS